jgi:purine-nucleoside phosphorylase
LILGSGLGDLAEEVQDAVTISYGDIPHFTVSTVAGHAGQLVLGTLAGTPVVLMRGRTHLYEGYEPSAVSFPVRVMKRLGAGALIATNAAGGLNSSFQAGDLMALTDHVNLPGMAGLNPLRGPDEAELGPRFLNTSDCYDAELRATLKTLAAEAGATVREGVYAMVSGPNYESPAEVRFLRVIGADAVGMSTVPEVLVARHERMRVLGISAITNVHASEGDAAELSHHEVLETAERIKPVFSRLVKGVVATL